MVLASSFPDLDIPKVGLFQYNIDRLKQYGDEVALINGSNDQKITFRELSRSSVKLASALTRKGLKKQEVVALCTSNCIEYPLMVLGVSACNAITTTCNPQFTLDETLKQFQNCQPKFVFTNSSQVDKMLQIAKQVPSIQEVISLEEGSRCISLWDLISNDDGKDFPFDTPINIYDDIVLLPYSSGTTGVPKGVMITHYNFVSTLVILRGLGKPAPWTVAYSVIPMFHAYGLLRLFGFLEGLLHVVARRFQVKQTLDAIKKYKVTQLVAVPAVLMQLSNSPLLSNYDLSSVMLLSSGGSALAPKVSISSMKAMGALVVKGWGLTECILGATISMLGAPLNAAGFVAPNSILKVVDPKTRQELGVNEDGELLLRSPQVMKGYYKNPKANAVTFEDGWLRTGDIGHYDKYGLVYIVDRMKELIKYKGFQVAPAELEHLILDHPKVSDVGVVGIPDNEAGEVPKAFVVKRDPSLSADELKAFVEEKVSRYKYLRGGVQFVEQIARSEAGKILRRKLVELNPTTTSKL